MCDLGRRSGDADAPADRGDPEGADPRRRRAVFDHQLGWLAGHGVTRVVLSVGYRGQMLAEHVGDGARWGVSVRVVDEGDKLRGTAGALRLASDRGALDESFLVTYGDSFLPIDCAAVWERFLAAGRPALMTLFRNAGRWDTSNVIFDGDRVTLYDKHHRTRPAAEFAFIDYGLSALRRQVVERMVPAGEAPSDLAELFHALSVRGELAGMEAAERFFEIGSPAGLQDFEQWLRARA